MPKIYPQTILEKALPRNFFNKDLLTKKNLTLKQNAMQALILATTATKREIKDSVAKVADIYQKKIDNLEEKGTPKAKATLIAKDGEKLLRQRIEGIVILYVIAIHMLKFTTIYKIYLLH